MISAFAAIVSLVALVLAGVAIYQTRPAAQSSSPPAPVPTQNPIGAETATPASTTEGPEVSASEPEETGGPVSTALPSANAQYTLSYEDIKLTLRGTGRSVDLDQPVVNSTSATSDVQFSSGSIRGAQLYFDTVNVAIAKSPEVTPNECGEDIQLSPADQTVKLSQDLVLCAVTNGLGAVNEPERAKMARIIVDSISKDDVVVLTITTWEIPR